jgi:hypothetical protein
VIKLFTALFLSLWLMVTNPSPNHDKYERFIRWAGCYNAQVVTDTRYPAGTSQFALVPDLLSGEVTEILFVGTKPSQLTESDEMYIVAHETTHCLQWESRGVDFLAQAETLEGVKAIELEADQNAARLLCRYHRDGIRQGMELWDHVHELFGYEGDETHGTLAERKAAVAAVTDCTDRQEAP